MKKREKKKNIVQSKALTTTDYILYAAVAFSALAFIVAISAKSSASSTKSDYNKIIKQNDLMTSTLTSANQTYSSRTKFLEDLASKYKSNDDGVTIVRNTFDAQARIINGMDSALKIQRGEINKLILDASSQDKLINGLSIANKLQQTSFDSTISNVVIAAIKRSVDDINKTLKSNAFSIDVLMKSVDAISKKQTQCKIK